MKQISILLVFACACGASQVIMGGSGSKKDGAQFRYETRVEPAIAGQKLSGFGAGGLIVDERFHRYMQDGESKRFFGYDLGVEKQADGRLRVSFYPLSLTAEKLRLTNAAEWKQIPTPGLPANQLVSGASSEALAVELFVHPVTGQKIVDYLFFDGKPSPRVPAQVARDFTLDDVILTFDKMRLRRNGKQVEQVGGGMSGEAVYFYLPGSGRYVMTLAPNAELGFRRLGEVRGRQAIIRDGGDTFEIECDGPIAPGGGAFHLYVHHDAAWRPRDGRNEIEWGASQAKALVRPR